MKWWRQRKERAKKLKGALDCAVEIMSSNSFAEVQAMLPEPPYLTFEHDGDSYGCEVHFNPTDDGIVVLLDVMQTPVGFGGAGRWCCLLVRTDDSWTEDDPVPF